MQGDVRAGMLAATGDLVDVERGIVADLAVVKAWKADTTGNVVFRKTARNFNVPAATCGKVCVVEVEEVPPLVARPVDWRRGVRHPVGPGADRQA